MSEQPSHPRDDRPADDDQHDDDVTVRVREQVANDLGPEDAFGHDAAPGPDADA